jgi:hypothetical protein
MVLQWLPRFSIVLSQTQLRSGGSTICAGSDRLPGTRLNQIATINSDLIPAVSDGQFRNTVERFFRQRGPESARLFPGSRR